MSPAMGLSEGLSMATMAWARLGGQATVDESKTQRRPFQFSLRKLMIWTAVWAVYLGMMKWLEVPLVGGAVLTTYFAVILAIRIRW